MTAQPVPPRTKVPRAGEVGFKTLKRHASASHLKETILLISSRKKNQRKLKEGCCLKLEKRIFRKTEDGCFVFQS